MVSGRLIEAIRLLAELTWWAVWLPLKNVRILQGENFLQTNYISIFSISNSVIPGLQFVNHSLLKPPSNDLFSPFPCHRETTQFRRCVWRASKGPRKWGVLKVFSIRTTDSNNYMANWWLNNSESIKWPSVQCIWLSYIGWKRIHFIFQYIIAQHSGTSLLLSFAEQFGIPKIFGLLSSSESLL